MNQSEYTGPELGYDSYIAVALQTRAYGCRNREDIKKNMENQLLMIDHAVPHAFLIGGGPVKLLTIPEGSIQGFWDELSHMDHAKYCRDIAIRIPGEETEQLAKKAREYDVYIVAQAKVVVPDIAEDRYFNQGFIISPKGEIILQHTKNIISVIEGSTSPYDFWDKWSEKYGETLEAYYPVVKTDIGNLAVSICAETMFPETYRAFALMGAEVIVRMTLPEPLVSLGNWECSSRSRAFDNLCYLVCPNNGPYYGTSDDDIPYAILGGNSMLIDYRGNIITKVNHQNEVGVPGCIDIRALREYRATSPQAAHQVQMRSNLWKQIYERWPEYPKNLYMERTYSHSMERHLLHLELLEKYFEAGIYTRYARPEIE